MEVIRRYNYDTASRALAIRTTGLWHDLPVTQQKRLKKLGFDEMSWNNVCREPVLVGEDDIYIGGDWTPKMYPLLIGDRAMEVEEEGD